MSFRDASNEGGRRRSRAAFASGPLSARPPPRPPYRASRARAAPRAGGGAYEERSSKPAAPRYWEIYDDIGRGVRAGGSRGGAARVGAGHVYADWLTGRRRGELRKGDRDRFAVGVGRALRGFAVKV